jgi:hypothetical protein
MAASNTLAYYDTAMITAVKSFIEQAPVSCKILIQGKDIKLFEESSLKCNKLECLDWLGNNSLIYHKPLL